MGEKQKGSEIAAVKIRMKAAVLRGSGVPLSIEEVELLEPLEGQVLVRLVATGVCHSDIHAIKGDIPAPLPCVLGHEGAGIVEEIGPGVTCVKPGDHVVISLVAPCGKCQRCLEGKPYYCDLYYARSLGGTLVDGSRRLRQTNGDDLFHFACQSSFAEYAVVNEGQLAKVGEDAPLTVAALFACGVMTGLGAVINHARVEAGASVAVFGCGGVGLSVIMGANLVGAERIIAVDVLENKLAKAKELGATDVVNASKDDAVVRIGLLSGGKGVDYAFEAVGITELMVQAINVIRGGGMAVLVGIPRLDAMLSFPAILITSGKTITSAPVGCTRPAVDIPRFLNLYMSGKLPVDKLLTRTYKLEEINDAMEALLSGKVIRSVIAF